ncbi:MAG: hypothetical protein HOQ05_12430 [Corynebacteriales bacterium]|nr:hypothetical protein [Mycobacteriales bacterium]
MTNPYQPPEGQNPSGDPNQGFGAPSPFGPPPPASGPPFDAPVTGQPYGEQQFPVSGPPPGDPQFGQPGQFPPPGDPNQQFGAGQPGQFPPPGDPNQQFGGGQYPPIGPPPMGQFPGQGPQKSNTGMLIGIIAVVVVLLLGIGIAGFVLLSKDDDSGDDKSSSKSDTKDDKKDEKDDKKTPDDDGPTGGSGGECLESSPCDVGETGTDNDGIDVSITKLEKGTPSDTACCPEEGDELYTFEVTFKNNGSKTVDLTNNLISGSTSSDPSGMTISQVFDYGTGLEGVEGELAPGDTKTAKVGFAMKPDVATSEVMFEIQADYTSGDGVFFATTPAG